MNKTRLGAAVLALATVTLLAGCGLFVSEVDPKPAPGASSETEAAGPPMPPFPQYSPAPLPVFERSSDPAITAAHDLMQANYDALVAGDWATACSYYSPLYIEDTIVFVSGAAEGTPCEAAVEKAFDGAREYTATLQDGDTTGFYTEQQLMPFYDLPTAISIDDAELTADSDSLVYATADAVHGTSAYAWRDDSGKLKRYGTSAPWQVTSTYLAKVDGRWIYVSKAEKNEL